MLRIERSRRCAVPQPTDPPPRPTDPPARHSGTFRGVTTMSMHRPQSGPGPRSGRQPLALALCLALAATLFTAPDVAAQNRLSSGLPTPRLLVVSPPGGKAGSTVEVVCAG